MLFRTTVDLDDKEAIQNVIFCWWLGEGRDYSICVCLQQTAGFVFLLMLSSQCQNEFMEKALVFLRYVETKTTVYPIEAPWLEL